MSRIIITGAYGTGSSAVLDLLREYDGVAQTVASNYEHMHLLCQHGLFELEARLYGDGACYISQDRAMSDFLDTMEMLARHDYSFFGSYRKLFGDRFMREANRLVEAISTGEKRSSIAHTTGTRFSLWKCALQLGARLLLRRKIHKWGRVYVTDGALTRYLLVGREEFLARANEFIAAYFAMCETSGARDYLYDHLLLATETALMERYFDDDTRLIVLTRDPRDVYLSDKYVWSKTTFNGQRGPMPRDAEDFCAFTRLNEQKCVDGIARAPTRVLRLRFEDLVYRYEETKARIEEFTGIGAERHTRPGRYFAPERSIRNTQVFAKDPAFRAEAELIAARLGPYCYPFPHADTGGIDGMFDFDPDAAAD